MTQVCQYTVRLNVQDGKTTNEVVIPLLMYLDIITLDVPLLNPSEDITIIDYSTNGVKATVNKEEMTDVMYDFVKDWVLYRIVVQDDPVNAFNDLIELTGDMQFTTPEWQDVYSSCR